ncbi:hypothetical protein ACFSO0_01355 [Brevibacillus sp. GCM10020057]|uniref:hypothetical protein n=1 Tax=Brevibacillus sp. GCM10020057 TaxID=3317327 RepID=UPI003632C225
MDNKIFKSFKDWEREYLVNDDVRMKFEKYKNDPVSLGASLAQKSLENAKNKLLVR